METITEKIKSLRETVGGNYVRPDPSLVQKYQDDLSRHPQALEYLTVERGLTHGTITQFKIGFDNGRKGISVPVTKGGTLVNIKYRLLEGDNARYTSEAGCETWLFNEGGLSTARDKDSILIVEGEIDCMSVWQMGIKNVISPAAGAQSYGPWLEQLEGIKRIYIAYDNDEAGRKAAEQMADRLGAERCFQVIWPEKDANDFLVSGHTQEELRSLIKSAKPFLASKFKNLGDVIKNIREGNHDTFDTDFIPNVHLGRGWLCIVSGRSNVGKTSFILNIANDFIGRDSGVLIMPFERGIDSVGQRYLQVMNDASLQDMSIYREEDWDEVISKASKLPLYFALPNKDEVAEFMVKSKRFFNTEVVIIDHLDYLVRQVNGNKSDAISDTLQQLKRVAEDNGIALIIVSHIRKIEAPGAFIAKARKPNIEDLKGSSSLFQDPEVVVMLSETLNDDEILVDVVKNKGQMSEKKFHINRDTGVFSDAIEGNFELWNSTPGTTN